MQAHHTQDVAARKYDLHDLASMRLAQEPWRWRKLVLGSVGLSAGVKVAAFAILEFVNRKNGRCFASYGTIAKSCGMTERGVRNAVAKLKAAGLIRTVQRGFNIPNLIFLTLPAGQALAGAEATGADAADAVPLDRHGDDARTGMAVPSGPAWPCRLTLETNLREEPKRLSTLESPSSELSLSEPTNVVPLHGEGKTDSPESMDRPITPSYDNESTKIRISNAAMRILGYGCGDRWPDGRYPDQVVMEALGEARIGPLVAKCRARALMTSELAMALLEAGIRPKETDRSLRSIQRVVSSIDQSDLQDRRSGITGKI